jgi:hypothetical protein
VAAKAKAPITRVIGACFNKSLTVTYSHMAKATLPSAQDVFTSEFGMGSGGSRPLKPSGKLGNPESFVSTLVAFD